MSTRSPKFFPKETAFLYENKKNLYNNGRPQLLPLEQDDIRDALKYAAEAVRERTSALGGYCMKFLVDNALSPLVAESLRADGFDTLHVRDIGIQDASDSIIFEQAEKEEPNTCFGGY